jgi:asparagine synthase (glutamine-hydrolysing)
MCGILGAINVKVPEEIFAQALATLKHRGPDAHQQQRYQVGFDGGLEPRVEVQFGHHRLAIIDLSPGGRQPMQSPDGRFSLIFNGEIYNYLALRLELEADGVVFKTQSDTEVLLWMLIRFGSASLTRLDGLFALAFVDCLTGTVLLARDHLGINPLYYACHEGGWVFASEVKAMLALGIEPRLRHELLGEYLANMWIMEPDTLFEGIYKLPAASWLKLETDTVSVQPERYWQPPQKIQPFASDAEALDVLLPKLERAVQSQMVADVPIGAYISGGVDSSLIAVLAARHSDKPLITVGARFQSRDSSYEAIPDDGVFIDRLVAQNPGFSHTDLELSSDLFSEYQNLIWFMDEPIADPAIVPAFLLAQKARAQGAVVMLSGMGGDELFGGYGRYTALPYLKNLQSVPPFLRNSMIALTQFGQRSGNGVFRKRAKDAERFLQMGGDAWPISYNDISGHFSLKEIDGLVGQNWRINYQHKLNDLVSGWEDESYLRQAQLIDIKGFLASHNAIYSNKSSMAASVEVRVPLVNVELTEFAFGLADHFKLHQRVSKPLLKKACAQLVGAEFAYRKKAGFAMPIRSWLRGDLFELVQQHVLSEEMFTLFPREDLQRLVSEHAAGLRDHTWKLWIVLTLSLWIEKFNVKLDRVALNVMAS